MPPALSDTAQQPIAARATPAPFPVMDAPADSAPTGSTGTLQGHVRLSGELPGNLVIRMGVDPLCSQLTEGKQMVQESVLTALDGSLANVFIRLQGDFQETPVPDEPVVIDQQDCIFVPRVVGARAGQLVQIKNSDPLLHNLNSVTTTTNRFNVGQPMQDYGPRGAVGGRSRTGQHAPDSVRPAPVDDGVHRRRAAPLFRRD